MQPDKKHLYFEPHGTARAESLAGTPLASFGQRAVAYLLDITVVFSSYAAAMAGLHYFLFDYLHISEDYSPSAHVKVHFDYEMTTHTAWVLWLILYFGLIVWRTNGLTPGKRHLHIRIVSLTHDRITLWQSIERALGYGASLLECGFGFIQYFIHPNHCCVHDRIAETIVVKDSRQPRASKPGAGSTRIKAQRKRSPFTRKEHMPSRLRSQSFLGVLLALTNSALLGQTTAPTSPKTSVNPDNTITFRLTYPGARKVSVRTDAALQPLPMTADATGLWTATTPPLQPSYYAYTFDVDGVHIADPLNGSQIPNYVELFSEILVPAPTPAPWELTAIPHGAVTHYLFTTRFGLHFPADQTGYVVYTPPAYDPKRKDGYPVLYLLHGFSSGEGDWTRYGKANLIMDRLLADGKIVPMIVVMPRGYGDFDLVGRGVNPPPKGIGSGFNSPLFFQTLTEEVIPAVERDYDVAPDRQNRAIAGVSMGGTQSVTMGLTHPELFAWVGGFSSAVPRADYDTRYPGADAQKANLRLLWIACGKDDFLYASNQSFIAWAKQKGFPVTAVETPGWHANFVWRNNLLTFAPLLFRK